jgi:hypothetical protein
MQVRVGCHQFDYMPFRLITIFPGKMKGNSKLQLKCACYTLTAIMDPLYNNPAVSTPDNMKGSSDAST